MGDASFEVAVPESRDRRTTDCNKGGWGRSRAQDGEPGGVWRSPRGAGPDRCRDKHWVMVPVTQGTGEGTEPPANHAG